MNHVAKRLIRAARKLLAEDLTLFETEPPEEEDFLAEFVAKRTARNPEFPRLVAEAATRMAKKRTPKKPCPSCGKRVPLHQVPPFEGHRAGCATVLHWNSKLPPKNVEGALLTRSELLKEAEDVEKAKMDFVIDALGSWSDEEIEQHLQELKSKLKGAHNISDDDVELQCWSKALAEFGDYLKSAAAPEIKLYEKRGNKWTLALVYRRDETQFGLDRMSAQEVADWASGLRGSGYKVVVDNQTFVTDGDGGARKIKS